MKLSSEKEAKISKGRTSAKIILKARILLKADQSEEGAAALERGTPADAGRQAQPTRRASSSRPRPLNTDPGMAWFAQRLPCTWRGSVNPWPALGCEPGRRVVGSRSLSRKSRREC